ncbi:MAG: OmpA family protein [Candidatus Gastranaerophilales bacterium]|nr:OmpA family protein [Candidatus Gastranaerophilales bacterium]
MNKEYYTNNKDYINRWVVSYADFVTMLLALFMVMYAVLRIDNQKLTEFQGKMQQTFTGSSNVTKYQATQVEKILKDNLSQSKSVKIIKSDKGLIIRVNNRVLFDEGSASIKSDAQQTLNEIVNVLTKIDNPVIIEGHTDSTPIKNAKYPSNWELSTARATNIISYITNTGRISPNRLRAVGYGEYMPIEDNTKISGRMLNRRVDIIVLEK